MATKSADLYARIEPDVKEQAELTEAELNAELEKGMRIWLQAEQNP